MKLSSNQIIEGPIMAINGLLKKDITIGKIIRSRWTTYIFVLTSILSMIYLVLAMNKGFNIHDEGDMVYAAVRILNGEIVYKDFWHNYAPGQFYLLAFLFYIFSPSLIVGRIYSIIVLICIPLTVYLLVSIMENRRIAIIAWGLSAIWVTSFMFHCSPIPIVVLFTLISCLFIHFFLRKRARKYLILSGVFAGFTTLFRHDIGIYLAAAQLIHISLFTIFGQNQRARKISTACVAVGRQAVVYMAGIAIIVLPIAIYFLANVPFRTLVEDLFVWNIKVFPEVLAIPYPLPSFRGIVFWFPPLMYILAAGYLAVGVYRKELDATDIRLWNLFLFLLIGVFFLNQAAMRSDVVHLFPTFFPAIIVLSILIENYRDEQKGTNYPLTPRPKRVLSFIVILVTILCFFKPLHNQIGNIIIILDGSSYVSMNVNRAKGISVQKNETAYEDAVRYIKNYVPEKERIFVGNFRHDRVMIGDIMFYFLSERHSATKYHIIGPGITTAEFIQEHIVNDIDAHEVQYIILRNIDNREPNLGRVSSEVYILDEYIQTHFEEVEQLGEHRILRRKI